MPSLDTLLAFLGISVLITLAPGPDNLMVIGHSLARGRRAGLAFGLGCAAGCLTHIAWATLGIAALVRASAGLFMAIKLAGAAYLLWLGIQALKSGGTLAPPTGTPARPWLHDLRRGFVANALNPKVALFFIAQTAAIFSAMACAAGAIGRLLARRPRVGPWLDRLCGVLFIGLAVHLASDSFTHK